MNLILGAVLSSVWDTFFANIVSAIVALLSGIFGGGM